MAASLSLQPYTKSPGLQTLCWTLLCGQTQTQLNTFSLPKYKKKKLRKKRRNTERSLLPFQEHVIVETVLDWGSVAQTAPVETLHGLSQDVSAGVPVDLDKSLWVRRSFQQKQRVDQN